MLEQQYNEMTRGATQCSSPWWGSDDCEGDYEMDLEGVSFVEWFGITDAEATPEDIAELNAMDEDADIMREWNAYYESTRL